MLYSCRRNTTYCLVNAYAKDCTEDSCVVAMTDLFGFEWDTMYVINGSRDIPEKYNRYRRADFAIEPHWPDLTIVFVKNAQIVHREYYDVRIRGAFDVEPHPIEFNSDQIEYVPSNAVFLIEEHSYHKRKYFELTPVDSLKTLKN